MIGVAVAPTPPIITRFAADAIHGRPLSVEAHLACDGSSAEAGYL